MNGGILSAYCFPITLKYIQRRCSQEKVHWEKRNKLKWRFNPNEGPQWRHAALSLPCSRQSRWTETTQQHRRNLISVHAV